MPDLVIDTTYPPLAAAVGLGIAIAGIRWPGREQQAKQTSVPCFFSALYRSGSSRLNNEIQLELVVSASAK